MYFVSIVTPHFWLTSRRFLEIRFQGIGKLIHIPQFTFCGYDKILTKTGLCAERMSLFGYKPIIGGSHERTSRHEHEAESNRERLLNDFLPLLLHNYPHVGHDHRPISWILFFHGYFLFPHVSRFRGWQQNLTSKTNILWIGQCALYWNRKLFITIS